MLIITKADMLVDRDIESGKRVIEALDNSPLRVDAALWLYSPDLEEWRFVIATPMIDDQGPKEAYTVVQSALRSLQGAPSITLDSVSIVSPGDRLIQTLTRFFKAGPSPQNLRFTRCTFDNLFIEDAWVYRLGGQSTEQTATPR